MTMTINEMFLFLMGLTAIFSPFGVIGPFGGFVSLYPQAVQGSIARRVALNVFSSFSLPHSAAD